MKRSQILILGLLGLTAAGGVLGFRGRASRGTAVDAAPPAAAAMTQTESAPSASSPSLASGAPGASSVPAAPSGPPRFVETFDVTTFQKGNIHTHTSWSDGDSPPQDVYLWYREHGYAFLALTDHNMVTDPAQFRLLERKGRFVMIPGEEVTMTGAGKQVHVNALCTSHKIGAHHFDTAKEALAWAVAGVTEQGGVALVNHPNFDWALTAADIPSARGAQLLEIFSGHPWVHTDGDEGHPSHEAIWDALLEGGETFAGVAVDDSHYFKRRPSETLAQPGRAWIEVFADAPERGKICAALRAGRLYASSGVKLKRIAVTEDRYAITPAAGDVEVTFLGKGGTVLQRGKPGSDGAASYALRGGEGYVRAVIRRADGKRAWTQPVRVGGG